MKNRKRFQKFMISAAALTTLVPFAARAGTAQAKWYENPKSFANQYSLNTTYGQAKTPYQKASGAGIGITQEKGNGDKSAAWVYDHESSGYLWPTKKVQGEPFGPKGAIFKKSREGKSGRYWIVYTVNNSQAGKVGMLYKNALMYYPKGNKKAVPLDVKITWNGTYRYAKDKHWNYGIGKTNVNLHFDTTDFNIKEPYMGAANFTLTLYKAGTNTPYAVYAPVTQTDIDYNQGLIFKDPAYLMAVSGARLNTGTYANWNTSTLNKSKIFGDTGGYVYSKRGKSKVNQGTVFPNQNVGWFTYLPKRKQSTYNLTFVHGFSNIPYGYNESPFKTPSPAKPKTYSLRSIPSGPANMDTAKNYDSDGQADLFGFDFKKGTVTPYKVPIDKWVSKTKGNFKEHSQNKPLEINDKQHAYFDVHTALKTPSIAYVDSKNDDSDYNGLPLKSAIKTQDDPIIKTLVPDARKHKQRLVLRDYIDPRLKVVGAHVYSSSWGDKYGKNLKATSAFKVGTGTATGNHDGYTVVDAVMTDHAAKASTHDTWGKNYHLVIEVEPKPNQLPEHSGPEPWTLISNEASLNDSYADAWSWLKVKFDRKDESHQHDDKSNTDLDSQKYVYRANLADKDKVQSGNIDDAKMPAPSNLVHPNEYLYYRLAFKLKNFTELDKKEAKDGKVYGDDDAHSKLINHRYKDFVITDPLSDKFRNKLNGLSERQVDKVHVSLKNSDLLDASTKHDFKVVGGNKLQIKLNNKDDKDILEKLDKDGGTIYVQYRVQIRPNEVSDDANKNLKPLNLDPTDSKSAKNEVDNQAKITGNYETKTRIVEESESTEYTSWESEDDALYQKW